MRYFILLSVAAFSLGASDCRLSANFHSIEDGKAYRSAQLTKDEFTESFQKLGIKTVINLRGEQPGDGWYDDEVAATGANGVKLINIHMGAKRLPHRADLLKLLDAFEHADYPILIHCKAGSDRTGEAAALYQMIRMGKSKAEALKQLNIKFGHMKKQTPAKDYFVSEVWQGVQWAYDDYFPCKGQYQYYNVLDPECTATTPPEKTPSDDDGDDT